MRSEMAKINLDDSEQWLAKRRSFINIVDAHDKVVFTAVAVKYIQSRLYNVQCHQEGFKSMKVWAERHSEEINLFKELNKVDRSRTNVLQKKLDERVALTRSQFKKCSFRVSSKKLTVIKHNDNTTDSAPLP